MPGPDHGASLEPAAFAAMVDGIRAATSALGSGRKIPVDAERDVARGRSAKPATGRRTCARAPSSAPDDLVALRPGTGIAPAERDSLVGRTVRRGRPGRQSRCERDDVAAAPDGIS